jgi:hypothetical protein
MDVGGIGKGSPNLPDPLVRQAAAQSAISPTPSRIVSAAISQDRVATSFQELASRQIHELLESIDSARLAQDPMLLRGLLEQAAAAVVAQKVPNALASITELIKLDPERGAQMVNAEASLAPIRGEVNSLLQRLALSARLEAEHALATASLAIEAASPRVDLDASSLQDVLVIAQRLFDSGQHINFVRSDALAQTVIAYCAVPVIDTSVPDRAVGRRSGQLRTFDDRRNRSWLRFVIEWLKARWQRYPFLFLLLGWFVVGMVGAVISFIARDTGQTSGNPTAVEIWAVGFLVLVVFRLFTSNRRRS